MKSQSKLLKVISIIFIIFGGLGLVSNICTFAMRDSINSIYEQAGLELTISAGTIAFSVLFAIIELAAGIVGVMYKNRKLVMAAAIALIALEIINVIINSVTIGFSGTYLLGFLLPILYAWGWYQSN